MEIKIILDNPENKASAFYQDFLRELWLSDNSRPWHIYSVEQFRRFWDDKEVIK